MFWGGGLQFRHNITEQCYTFAFMNSETVIVPIILLFIMLKVMKSFITPRKITMH